MKMKKCNKCKEMKEVGEFSKDRSCKDGLGRKCKECVKVYQEANKEEIAAYAKAYREENKEEIDARDKVYRDSKTSELPENSHRRKMQMCNLQYASFVNRQARFKLQTTSLRVQKAYLKLQQALMQIINGSM
jgi:hypothetical protein